MRRRKEKHLLGKGSPWYRHTQKCATRVCKVEEKTHSQCLSWNAHSEVTAKIFGGRCSTSLVKPTVRYYLIPSPIKRTNVSERM